MASRGIIDAHRIRTADVRAFMRELAQPTLPRAGENRDSEHPDQGEKLSESDTRAGTRRHPGIFGGFLSMLQIKQRLLQRVRVMSHCLCRWA